MNKLLTDKIIFLTGGSRGIEYNCAKAYIEQGAKVVIAALELDEVGIAMTEFGPEHLGVVCDVSSAASMESAIGKVIDRYGRIDVIHNNAGIADPSSQLHETTEEEWDKLMSVNIKPGSPSVPLRLEGLEQ